MNRQQKAYTLAKSIVKLLRERQEAAEHRYIIEKEIMNADGTTPTAIYCIDDSEALDRCNLDFSELTESKSNWIELMQAEDSLKAAEERLIKYGLNIIPVEMDAIKQILTKSYKTNYTIRLKLIELILLLDTGTVKGAIK